MAKCFFCGRECWLSWFGGIRVCGSDKCLEKAQHAQETSKAICD